MVLAVSVLTFDNSVGVPCVQICFAICVYVVFFFSIHHCFSTMSSMFSFFFVFFSCFGFFGLCALYEYIRVCTKFFPVWLFCFVTVV